MGIRWTNATTCKIAWPYTNIGNFVRISKVLVITYNHLINDSTNPFCVWKYGIRCSTSIPIDVQ